MSVYIDTSALAKWYVREARSDDFEAFINKTGQGVIARLAVVEFRCMLARRRRAEMIGRTAEAAAFRTFERDARDGYWRIEPMNDAHMLGALDVLEKVKSVPLRTLDALHLAVALTVGAERIATADKIMAQAAKTLRIPTITFFD